MSAKPTIHDILQLTCERFGLTWAEALAITKTPTHPRELRDEFAGQAMQALVQGSYFDVTAKMAYDMADAMLKARAA